MTASRAELALRYGIDPALILPEPERLPPPELFPRREAWVVRKQGGRRALDIMSWGFPPPGGKGAPVTNVRNLASPFWRGALANPERRCLVPASDFCEWGQAPDPATGRKPEHWFSVHEAPLFAFAGVWRPTEQGRAFAFLTCEANPIVAPIHPKAMPVILQPDDYERWLDAETGDACALAAPFPSQLMRVV